MGDTHKINQLLIAGSANNANADYSELVKCKDIYQQSNSSIHKVALIKACAKFYTINEQNKSKVEYIANDSYQSLNNEQQQTVNDVFLKIKDDLQLRKIIEGRISGDHIKRVSIKETFNELKSEYEKIKSDPDVDYGHFLTLLKNLDRQIEDYDKPVLSTEDKIIYNEMNKYINTIIEVNEPDNSDKNLDKNEWDDWYYDEAVEAPIISAVMRLEKKLAVSIESNTLDFKELVDDCAMLYTIKKNPDHPEKIDLEIKPEAVKYIQEHFTEDHQSKLGEVIDYIINNNQLNQLFLKKIEKAATQYVDDHSPNEPNQTPKP